MYVTGSWVMAYYYTLATDICEIRYVADKIQLGNKNWHSKYCRWFIVNTCMDETRCVKYLY